jgi:hypothetical protein
VGDTRADAYRSFFAVLSPKETPIDPWPLRLDRSSRELNCHRRRNGYIPAPSSLVNRMSCGRSILGYRSFSGSGEAGKDPLRGIYGSLHAFLCNHLGRQPPACSRGFPHGGTRMERIKTRSDAHIGNRCWNSRNLRLDWWQPVNRNRPSTKLVRSSEPLS